MKGLSFSSSLVFLALALGLPTIGWGDEAAFHPGDILKVSVEVGTPAENIGSLTSFWFGQHPSHLTYNPATHRLEGLFQVPAYENKANPVAHFEMDTSAGVWGMILGGRDFTAPRFEGIKTYTAKPVLKNVQAVAKDKTTLSVSYDVEDETGVDFSYIQVTGEYGDRADHQSGPTRRYFTPGDKSEFADCTDATPAHCTVELKLPEAIPGTPALSIEVQNGAGTREFFTSYPRGTVKTTKDFDFSWPSRPVDASDLASIQMGPVTLVGQTGRQVHLQFTVSGEASFATAESNIDIGEEGQIKEQITAKTRFVYHPETKTVDLTVELPAKSASRSVILIPGVTATNAASTFVFLPKSFSDRLDTSVIQVDTTKPQFGAVSFRLATQEEIAQAIAEAKKGN